MTYSSKQQEDFFKPWRLKVLHHGAGLNQSDQRYSLVIFDELQHKVIAKWVLYPQKILASGGYWTDSPPNPIPNNTLWNSQTYVTKGSALDKAKQQAALRQLPFDLKRDVVSEYEVTQGPVQSCLICGARAGRSFLPLICDTCKHAVALGREMMEGKRFLYAIEARDMLEYGRVDDPDKRCFELTRLLATLAGTTLGAAYDKYTRRAKDIIAGRRSEFGGNWMYEVYLTEAQPDTIRQIFTLVKILLDEAYKNGRERGENLLQLLAEGQVTIDQFADKSVRNNGRKATGADDD